MLPKSLVRLLSILALMATTTNLHSNFQECTSTCRWIVNIDPEGNVSYQLLIPCTQVSCTCPLPSREDAKNSQKKPVPAERSSENQERTDPRCVAYVPPDDPLRPFPTNSLPNSNISLANFALLLPTQPYLDDGRRRRTHAAVALSSESGTYTIGTVRPGVRIAVTVIKLAAAPTVMEPPLANAGSTIFWISVPFKDAQGDKRFQHHPINASQTASGVVFTRTIVDEMNSANNVYLKFSIRCVEDPF